MSTRTLYAVLDRVSNEINAPTWANGDADASRGYVRSLLQAKRQASQEDMPFNPADYALIRLGTIDTKTGALTPVDGVPPFVEVDTVGYGI